MCIRDRVSAYQYLISFKVCDWSGHIFGASGSPRSLTKKMAMPPSSTVHGGQHDPNYVTFELLTHAAFVADEIWGFMSEPTRITTKVIFEERITADKFSRNKRQYCNRSFSRDGTGDRLYSPFSLFSRSMYDRVDRMFRSNLN